MHAGQTWRRLILGSAQLALLGLVAVACSADDPPTTVSGTDTTAPTTAPPSTEISTTAPPTTAVSTTTSAVPPTTDAAVCLERLPVDVRLGQLLLPVVTPDEVAAATTLAERGRIAGVVVIGSPDGSISDDIAALQAASLVAPSIVAVDEEGGRVQRLERVLGPIPSAREVAASRTPAEARADAAAHAERVAELGFTMNLTPVLDLDTGSYVTTRSFGSDPDAVTEYGEAVADGVLDAGLTPVAKHFPGHGRGTDSHLGLPVLPDLDELRASDLVPFEAMAARGDVPIMVGHLVVPDLTGDEPATLSRAAITDLLRGELGFDGLVLTDAFNMEAIAASRDGAEAAELALRAGADLAMLGQLADVDPTLVRLLGAVNDDRLDPQSIDASLRRVLAHKGVDPCELGS